VTRKARQLVRSKKAGYESVLLDLVPLIDAGRKTALRSVNAIMTATYWAIGRRSSRTSCALQVELDMAKN
jgi:hypothetical protein